jgi:hypothetical protein
VSTTPDRLGVVASPSHDAAMPPVRPIPIPALLLRRASESRPPAQGPDDYDVVGNDGEVIGRIVKAIAAPAGTPWMWTLVHGRDEYRTSTSGYEATREAAMQAFARSWHRE